MLSMPAGARVHSGQPTEAHTPATAHIDSAGVGFMP